MDVTYQNSASCSYLVVTAGQDGQILDYQISMLECNRPEYLLPMEMKRDNGNACFYFDITSRLTLEFLLKRKKLKRNEFVRILADIARALVDCEGYLLKDSCFLLDAGFIYTDPETLKIYMTYIPVKSVRNMAEAFKAFVADLILHHANIEEAGSDNFLQRILGFVKRDNFNIGELLRMLEELVYQPRQLAGNTLEEAEKRPEAAAPVEVPMRVEKGMKKVVKIQKLLVVIGAQCVIAAAIFLGRTLFESTPGKAGVTYGAIILIILAVDVLLFKRLFYKKANGNTDKFHVKKPEKDAVPKISTPPGLPSVSRPPRVQRPPAVVRPPAAPRPSVQGKTELLGSMKPAFPTLRSRNPAEFEEIIINKPDFVIGRLMDQVDHVCKNNAVGKVHALVTVRDGNIWIRDLNSVNGTFVNDTRIESNKDTEVRSNDCIMLANSGYVLVWR